MNTQYFMYQLLPHRADFGTTMSPEERAIMQQHVAYWSTYAQQGKVVVFGPVADPEHNWGFGVIKAADREEVVALAAQDPAIVGDVATYRVNPIPSLIRGVEA